MRTLFASIHAPPNKSPNNRIKTDAKNARLMRGVVPLIMNVIYKIIYPKGKIYIGQDHTDR